MGGRKNRHDRGKEGRGQRGCRRKGMERFEVRKKISKRKINRGQEHCDREQTNHLERGGGKRSAVWCEK